MTSIQPIRSLFANGIIVLSILLLLIEAGAWSIAGEAKLNVVNQNGGVLPYFSLLVRNILFPETMTVFILALLMNWNRHWFKIKLVDITWKTLIRYQLRFLPILLIAFVVFIPFTQSVRYLMVEFPDYSFHNYWYTYIMGSYSLTSYFGYLFPVLLIGYGSLNLSLVTGSLRDRPLMI